MLYYLLPDDSNFIGKTFPLEVSSCSETLHVHVVSWKWQPSLKREGNKCQNKLFASITL